jgi:hypothetical protein
MFSLLLKKNFLNICSNTFNKDFFKFPIKNNFKKKNENENENETELFYINYINYNNPNNNPNINFLKYLFFLSISSFAIYFLQKKYLKQIQN